MSNVTVEDLMNIWAQNPKNLGKTMRLADNVRTELESLIKDRERLEFMIQEGCIVAEDMDELFSFGRSEVGSYGCREWYGISEKHSTPREAIDDAMSKTNLER